MYAECGRETSEICNEQNYLNALYLLFRYVICAAVLRNTQEVMINYS